MKRLFQITQFLSRRVRSGATAASPVPGPGLSHPTIIELPLEGPAPWLWKWMKSAPCAARDCPWPLGLQGEGEEPQSVLRATGQVFPSLLPQILTSTAMGFVNSLVYPSSGGKCQALSPSSPWAAGPILRAHWPSLCAGHCTGLARGPLRRLFPLTWKHGEGPLPRSALTAPPPKIWPPLAPPPALCPRNSQSTHLAFLGTTVVRQTTLKGLRLQPLPPQNLQSFGRLPSHHQPRGPSPQQRTRSTWSCQVAQAAVF